MADQQRFTLLQNWLIISQFMQAVGSEVIVVIIPILTILAVAVYAYRTAIQRVLHQLNVYVFGQQRQIQVPHNAHPAFGDGQCSICLSQPKQFEVSATCGHSFCSACLFVIHQRSNQQLKCPLCRKPITTMMISFNEAQQPADRRAQMIQKIKLYNSRYDDNRPLIRRIQEFPYMLRRIGTYLTRPQFWIFFIRSYYFFRIIFLAFIYIILPLDLIPERLFGVAGFIDDILVFGFLILFGLTIFMPIFIRRHA